MTDSYTLQCLLLGAVLGNAKRLASVSPEDFGDTELADIIARLKKSDVDGLATWLKERGVKWERKEPSIDAIHARAKHLARLERARRAASQARFLDYTDAERLKNALQKLADSIC